LAQFAIHGASVTFVDVSECARFGGMIICIAYMWPRGHRLLLARMTPLPEPMAQTIDPFSSFNEPGFTSHRG